MSVYRGRVQVLALMQQAKPFTTVSANRVRVKKLTLIYWAKTVITMSITASKLEYYF